MTNLSSHRFSLTPVTSFRRSIIQILQYGFRLLFFPPDSIPSPPLMTQSSTPPDHRDDESMAELSYWIEAYRRDDDQEAFQKIFEYYRSRLWQKLHLRRFYGYEPEDLFQEVNRDVASFLKSETPQNLMGLVYRIADRKIVDFLRSKAPFQGKNALISLEVVENHLAGNETGQLDWSHSHDLQRFLFSKFINTKQREVLVLHYLLGHTIAEIQAQTGLPLNTVKSRLREGLRKLRHYFSRQDPP